MNERIEKVFEELRQMRGESPTPPDDSDSD
jgi:hypothetical protein